MISRRRMCIPSTSASVAMTTLLYLKSSRPSSIFKAACNKLNSSFSYTTFLVSPKLFNGLPFRENTACVFTSRLLVIDPDALSPSVINSVVSNLLSPFGLAFLSFKCTRQSLNFLLCRDAFFARSRANFRIPWRSFRSRSARWIFFKIASATSAFLCKKLSSSFFMKLITYVRTWISPGAISSEPNFVFVWDSKTGSITFNEIAPMTQLRTSEASKFFP